MPLLSHQAGCTRISSREQPIHDAKEHIEFTWRTSHHTVAPWQFSTAGKDGMVWDLAVTEEGMLHKRLGRKRERRKQRVHDPKIDTMSFPFLLRN